MDLPVTFRAYLFICLVVRAVTVNAERKDMEKRGLWLDRWHFAMASFRISSLSTKRGKTQSKGFLQVCVQGTY